METNGHTDWMLVKLSDFPVLLQDQLQEVRAREVHVEWFAYGVWNLVYRRINSGLCGSEEMYLR